MSAHVCGRADRQRGFSVIELLIALGIVISIAAVVAQMVPPARVAFDRVPADLDLQQRGRIAIDVLSQALRSAGRDVPATGGLGQLSELLPTVSVTDAAASGSAFRAITVIAPTVEGAQGVLESDQASPSAPITLATSPCPNVSDVCGFASGTTAMIVGGGGAFDVFEIDATVAAGRWLTPNRALSRAYPAGSAVIEVERDTFRIAEQSNGSRSLIRETAAGAVQPIVDFVTDLSFEVQGADVPAGFFQSRQIDVSIRLQAQTEWTRRLISDRVFKTAIRLRNAS